VRNARRLLLAAAAGAALETGASACADYGEESRIAAADLVIDGVATCSFEEELCRVRVREVIRPDSAQRSPSRSYSFRFDLDANERHWRWQRRTGVILMCVVPWEPKVDRFQGRFYLTREESGYSVRQDSARGKDPDRSSAVEEE
jgi:hypothetical protein